MYDLAISVWEDMSTKPSRTKILRGPGHGNGVAAWLNMV